MAEALLILTALVIVAAAARAYQLSRDPLHPLLFVAPMMLYMFVFRPAILLEGGQLQQHFRETQILFVFTYKLFACALFSAGCLHRLSRVPWRARTGMECLLSPRGRDNAYLIGCLLGAVAMLGYAWTIYERGGFFYMYAQPYAPYFASSGYISTAHWLALPAVMFLAISRQGLRLRMQDLVLVGVFISAVLVHGVLGARRGPTFSGVCTLILAWYTFAKRRPSVPQVIGLVGSLGLLVLALVVYRNEIYLGSNFDVEPKKLSGAVLAPGNVDVGEEVIYSSGLILTVLEHGHVNWGTRWVVSFLVRPIPRQLWPTKYHDCGFGYVDLQESLMGYSPGEWVAAVGFVPAGGAAAAFDATLFADFSWGALALCYVMGMFFRSVWERERLRKGVWQLYFAILLAVSILLPTQDACMLLVHWLFMVIPVALIWYLLIARHTLSRNFVRSRSSISPA